MVNPNPGAQNNVPSYHGHNPINWLGQAKDRANYFSSHNGLGRRIGYGALTVLTAGAIALGVAQCNQPQPVPPDKQQRLDQLLAQPNPGVIISANDDEKETYHYTTSGIHAFAELLNNYSKPLADAIRSAKTDFAAYSVNVDGIDVIVFNPVGKKDSLDGNLYATNETLPRTTGVRLEIDDPAKAPDKNTFLYPIDMEGILTLYNHGEHDLYFIVPESRALGYEGRDQQNNLIVIAKKGFLSEKLNRGELEKIVVAIEGQDGIGKIDIDSADNQKYGGLPDSHVYFRLEVAPEPYVPKAPIRVPTRVPTRVPAPVVSEPTAVVELTPLPTYTSTPTIIYIPSATPTATWTSTPIPPKPTATPTATPVPPKPSATPGPVTDSGDGGRGGRGDGGTGTSRPQPDTDNNNDRNDSGNQGNDSNNESGSHGR